MIAVLAACGSSSEPNPGPGPEPKPVPPSLTFTEAQAIFSDSVTLPGGQRTKLELTARSGELQLNTDGSYQQAVRYFARIHGTVGFGGTWTDHGLWTRQGDSLFFDSEFVEAQNYAGELTELGMEITQDILGLGGVGLYRYAG